ncbi:MAG: ABC transporter permease [Candidatus Hodarchaeota archaeon]
MANEFIDGMIEAFVLIFTFDQEIWDIILLSIRVSGTATFLAALVALPLGSYLGLHKFRGKKTVSNLINTFMGFPPVVMGLIIFLLLSRSGPLGGLALLYTTTAMIVAQFLLAIPIIIGTTKAAIESVDPALKETVQSLGSSESQLWWELIKESKKSIIAGILVAFGQAISEVGAVIIVGGNIRWHTRTFTTAIVVHTRMGEFGMAIALGMILIIIAFILNYTLTHLQSEKG